MDSAGSIAVDEERAKRLKQEYYNVVEKGRSEPINRNNKDVVSCSSCSPTLSRPKKILSGRIVKKYRLSLRNVVHSTQQQWRQQGGKQNETGPAIAGHRTERLWLRDQINHWHFLYDDLLKSRHEPLRSNFKLSWTSFRSVQCHPVGKLFSKRIPASQCY